MNRKKKNRLAVVMIIAFAISTYLGFLGFKTLDFFDKIRSDEKVESLEKANKDEKINILILGIDSGKFFEKDRMNDVGRTDTIMVASFDPKNKKVNLLSIPRDSRVEIPGRGFDKADHAHAFGGVDLTVKTVQNLLGIPIHHYAKINFEGFVNIVEAVGGVTVEVKKSDLQGVINYEKKRAVLKPGIQRLDGEQAFQYVRIRNGDIGRVERQQKFIKALMKETLSVGTIWRSPAILDAVAESLDTDMSAGDMLNLATKTKGMSGEAIETEILPGKGKYVKGISYWVVDEKKKEEIVERFFKNK